jgi:metal-responsive CopG/Arc/MetJ family transcriptional regulator
LGEDVVIPKGAGHALGKVAVTLPEELYQMEDRARMIEHRSRSELIQEAVPTEFDLS